MSGSITFTTQSHHERGQFSELHKAENETVVSIFVIGINLFWEDNPRKDRLFFVKGMPPFGEKRTHHIHMMAIDSGEWLARIQFRDYLNQHEKERKAYESLKIDLAKRFGQDREAYTAAKAEFVASVVRRAQQNTSPQSPS